jgi:hypothetical protein
MSTRYRELRHDCPLEGCPGKVMIETLHRPRPGGESGYRCSTMALFHIPPRWTPQVAREKEAAEAAAREAEERERILTEDDPLF